MAVTQKEIAEKLGVSQGLVGFALNGNGRIADDTRALILREAQRLGYNAQQNREARALIARRYGKRVTSDIIAVLLPPQFEGVPLRSVPFFMPMLDGVELEAAERKLDVSFCLHRQVTPPQLPRLIQERIVDGVIGLQSSMYSELIQQNQIPFVVLGSRYKGADGVAADDRSGVFQVTQHLIELGHRKIAYLGHPLDNQTSMERHAGYREALSQYGLPCRKERVEVSLRSATPDSGATGTAAILKRTRDFTALVCHHDVIAMGAIQELQAAGFRVPEDISVTGFDDVSLQYEFKPGITSVSFDRKQMGRRAVQLLCKQIAHACGPNGKAGQEAGEKSQELLPVQLVVQDSSAPPRLK